MATQEATIERAEKMHATAEALEEKGDTSSKPNNGERAAELHALADFMLPESEEGQDIQVHPSGGSENGVCFSTVEPLPTAWLWEGRFPFEEVVLLFGEGGVGKSFFTCDLVARITNGWPMPDGTPSVPGTCIMVCPEDKPRSTIVQRLMAAGADLKKVYNLSKVSREAEGIGDISAATNFKIPDDLPILREVIIRTHASFVVIDPMMATVNDRISTFRNQTVRAKVLDPLEALAEETGVCILVVGHFTKGNSKDIIQKAGGSAGITQKSRMVHAIVGDTTNPDQKVLVNAKNNLCKKATNMKYEIVPSQIPGAGKLNYLSGFDITYVPQVEANDLADARQRILGVLESENRFFTAIEINLMSGINESSTVRTHLSHLRDEGRVIYNRIGNLYCSMKWLKPDGKTITPDRV